MDTPNSSDVVALLQMRSSLVLAPSETPSFSGLVFALLLLRHTNASAEEKALVLRPWTSRLSLHLAPAEAGVALLNLRDHHLVALALQQWCTNDGPPGCRLTSPNVR